ncbi:hypothetical protein VNO78_32975 [Psophocarpus tetragonolobus]|uniref:Uncharacterized protein n=1 Tax=Psophocarpus tetragonolobus TaxID=3891 RepID=A0AAN9RPT4_PSOTE
MEPKFTKNLPSPFLLSSSITLSISPIVIDSDEFIEQPTSPIARHGRSLSMDSYFLNVDRIIVTDGVQSDDEEIIELQRTTHKLETKLANLSTELAILQIMFRIPIPIEDYYVPDTMFKHCIEQCIDINAHCEELQIEIEELTEESQIRDIYNQLLQEQVGFLRAKASGLRATIANHPVFGEFYDQLVMPHQQAHLRMLASPSEQSFNGENNPYFDQKKYK